MSRWVVWRTQQARAKGSKESKARCGADAAHEQQPLLLADPIGAEPDRYTTNHPKERPQKPRKPASLLRDVGREDRRHIRGRAWSSNQ